MTPLSITITILFILTVICSIVFFARAAKWSKKVFLVLISMALIQSLMGVTGFYQQTGAIPPRFLLLIGPSLLIIGGLFLTRGGKTFIDSLDFRSLTVLHIVRIPVELVLFYLFVEKMIPAAMTFDGVNFDIASGLSVPFALSLSIGKPLHRKILLVWNFVCLLLLLNIVTIAILSAPTPFQQIAFDQPNIAVLFFPYVLLPAVIVPLVLLSHFAAIRQLLRYSG